MPTLPRLAALALCTVTGGFLLAQTPDQPPPRGGGPSGLEPGFPGPGGFGPGGFDPGGFGPGGPGPRGFGPGDFGPGGMQPDLELVKQFDQNGNGFLDLEERQAARVFLNQEGTRGRPGGPGGRRGGFGGPGGAQEVAEPGIRLRPADVSAFPDRPVYDGATLRTFFLDFESDDWEQELADFRNTDVEVPARLTVDGRSYPNVGVRFRGNTSYMMVGAGWKRPLNLSLDYVHNGQNLGGYRTFNLLNSINDPSYLRAVLYHHIAREYIPSPLANFVRVVINGENWGIYASVQQFNKDFINDWFGTSKGARWKVPGSPGGRAGLNYLGEDPAPYQRLFEIKTKDDPAMWAELIRLCRVLHETPPDQLETALEPLLDIEGTLRFLAIENVLVNQDGYWTRASDYSLYRDTQGRFHLFPYDVNESFSTGGGPGGPGGPRGAPGGMMDGRGRWEMGGPGGMLGGRGPGGMGGPGGMLGGRGPGGMGGPGRMSGPGGMPGPGERGGQLDPLVAVNDPGKPLLSTLLTVPSLRTRYLTLVRDIADQWLDWKRLGPVAQAYHDLIAEAVKVDTKKLDSFEAFETSLTGDAAAPALGRPGGGRGLSLKAFADQRRAFLLAHPEVQKVTP